MSELLIITNSLRPVEGIAVVSALTEHMQPGYESDPRFCIQFEDRTSLKGIFRRKHGVNRETAFGSAFSFLIFELYPNNTLSEEPDTCWVAPDQLALDTDILAVWGGARHNNKRFKY